MTALQFFRIIAKQFADMSDADVEAWLAIALLNANTACLVGDRLALAQALYAAHMLFLDASNSTGEGGRGNIKMEKEGDLQRQYGSSVGGDTWLGLSPYGTQYNDMLLGCSGAGIMTRYGNNPPLYIDDDFMGSYGYGY